MYVSRNRPNHLIACCLLAAIALAASSSANAGEAAAAHQNVYTRLLKSTAYVMSPANAGTAWVYDREHGLLLTNYHVVDNHETGQLRDTMDVIFPVYENGRVVAEQSYYFSHEKELRRSGRWVEARVIDAKPSVDLAMLKVDHLPNDVTAVPLAAESPMPSDHLHSIGNPGGSEALWLYTLGEVKQVYRKNFPVAIGHRMVHIDSCVVETQSPTNHGDSGGPVVNDAGELVGVTQSVCGSDASLINTDIDVSEVRAYISADGWMGKVATAADYARRSRHYDTETYFDAREPQNCRVGVALADINEAIRRDPNQAAYYLDRARIEEERGLLALVAPTIPRVGFASGRGLLPPSELVAAENDVKSALRLEPKNARAHARLASIYRTEGAAPSRVVEELKTAVALDANCADAYEQMYSLALSKDAHLAIHYLNEVIRLHATDAGAIASRAEAYELLGDHKAALHDYNLALELRPACASFHRGRAAVYKKLNNVQDAVTDMVATAMKLEQDNVRNWTDLGTFLVSKGLCKEAITVYSLGLQFIDQLHMESASPELLAGRGKAYAAGGDSDHARQDYLAAMKLVKSSPVRNPQLERELNEDLKKLEAVSMNN